MNNASPIGQSTFCFWFVLSRQSVLTNIIHMRYQQYSYDSCIATVWHYLYMRQPLWITGIVTAAITCPTNAEFWRIVSGRQFCEIVDGGRCVTDGNGNYGNNERCEVVALKRLVLSTKEYFVEKIYDYVTVNGVRYIYSGPQNVYMAIGAKLKWHTDQTGFRHGFKVCASSAGGSTVNLWDTCMNANRQSYTNANHRG